MAAVGYLHKSVSNKQKVEFTAKVRTTIPAEPFHNYYRSITTPAAYLKPRNSPVVAESAA